MPHQKIARKKESRSASASPLDLTELAALPAITPQQHAYVEARLQGLSPRRAYDVAYPSHHGRSEKTSQRRGVELDNHPRLAAWIAAGRAARASQGAYTIDAATSEAEEARRMSARSGNAGAVVGAVKLKAQLNGLLIERQEVTHVDLAGMISALGRLGIEPGHELYERLAKRVDAAQVTDLTAVAVETDTIDVGE